MRAVLTRRKRSSPGQGKVSVLWGDARPDIDQDERGIGDPGTTDDDEPALFVILFQYLDFAAGMRDGQWDGLEYGAVMARWRLQHALLVSPGRHRRQA